MIQGDNNYICINGYNGCFLIPLLDASFAWRNRRVSVSSWLHGCMSDTSAPLFDKTFCRSVEIIVDDVSAVFFIVILSDIIRKRSVLLSSFRIKSENFLGIGVASFTITRIPEPRFSLVSDLILSER